MRSSISLALATLALAVTAAPALAAELDTPEGRVILTVTGEIENTNSEGAAEFDIEMLGELEGRETVTTNPWYEGPQTYEGPLGSALLDAVGATGSVMKIVALNDFVAEVPVEDFRKWPVILATSQNGEAMSVREKGPIFVIYPFDEYPELKSDQVYTSRSAWQVKSIEIQ